jgi:hypothetical protein
LPGLGLDLDAGLIIAAAITPGNRPESEAAADLLSTVEQQGFSVEDCHIDRGYLAADAIAARRRAGMRVYCKAFPLRNHGRYATLDFEAPGWRRGVRGHARRKSVCGVGPGPRLVTKCATAVRA